MSSPHFTASRILPFGVEKVRQAWTTPNILATWWGPAGFSNEFETCDITPGGDWIFDMVSADGVRYPNVSKWLEVADDHVAIEHVNAPHFFMRAEFESVGEDTRLTWTGIFDSDAIYEGMKHIIVPANEQNLDRLEACLGSINNP